MIDALISSFSFQTLHYMVALGNEMVCPIEKMTDGTHKVNSTSSSPIRL